MLKESVDNCDFIEANEKNISHHWNDMQWMS